MSESEARSSGGPDDFVEAFKLAYREALRELGRFNIAVFGKTGAGKSTLINAVFGSEIAETGIGKPVTTKTTYYEHPSGYLGVYDSEGAETGEAGDAILEKFHDIVETSRSRPLSEQVHVIWYCVRATDLRFEDEQARFVQSLAADGIPVLLVLTQVQMNDAGEAHPEAISLSEDIMGRDLPLSPENIVFLTMAKEDQWSGREAHGLQELLDATFRVAPAGVENALTAAQRIDLEAKVRRARRIVTGTAAMAATTAATPIPGSDAPILVGIQIVMMGKICAIFGLSIKTGTLATIAGSAFAAGGIAKAGVYLSSQLLKAIPGGQIIGGTINAGVAASLTSAAGEAWIKVCLLLIQMDSGDADALTPKEIREKFFEYFKRSAEEGGPEGLAPA